MLRTLLLIATLPLTLVACGGAVVPNDTTSTATVAVRSNGYAALPQSTTSEGYRVLGNIDAPIVMTHYSDFL